MKDLERERIQAECARLLPGFVPPVFVVDQTASTNDDARRAGSEGAAVGTAFFAEQQSAGRGRSGARWHSPPGENLYFSVVLRPRVEPQALPPLTLVLGLVVARVVDEALSSEAAIAGLKWPNDVIVLGKKISGLLLETSFRGGKLDAVIVGIGLNVHTTSFPDELALRATSLRSLGAALLDRSLLAARLLVGIHEATARFEQGGLVTFLDELRARDVLLGVALEVGAMRGVGLGIDLDGSLLVRDDLGAVLRVGSGGVTPLGGFALPRRP